MIHATWIDSEPGKTEWKKGDMCMFCSNCKHRAGKYKHKTYRYCPWCGAKMDGEQPVVETPPMFDDEVRTVTFTGTIVRNE